MARMLLTTNSTARSPPSSSSSSSDTEQAQTVIVESDFVVILAALLCALICVVGLTAVARCAWLRRGINNNRGTTGPKPANKGLKKKVLQSLPKYTFDSSSAGAEKEADDTEVTDCAICLSEYVNGDEIRVMPQCGHGFHIQCIDLWLSTHSSCPTCRQILVGVRCQKCGEIPSGIGGNSKAQVSEECLSKPRSDCGTPSSSINVHY